MAESHSAAKALMIRLDGIFDVSAARLVLEKVAGAPPGSEIYVDLTHVRDFQDHGVALLAEALAQARSRVSVRGLRQHQVRMLRYLGVDPAALEAGRPRVGFAPAAETA